MSTSHSTGTHVWRYPPPRNTWLCGYAAAAFTLRECVLRWNRDRPRGQVSSSSRKRGSLFSLHHSLVRVGSPLPLNTTGCALAPPAATRESARPIVLLTPTPSQSPPPSRQQHPALDHAQDAVALRVQPDAHKLLRVLHGLLQCLGLPQQVLRLARTSVLGPTKQVPATQCRVTWRHRACPGQIALSLICF